MKVCVVGDKNLPSDISSSLSENSVAKVKLSDIKDLLKVHEDVSSVTCSVKDNADTESLHHHQPIHEHTPFPGISQLLPTLYLCGAGVAIPSISDKLAVKFIINVAPELPDTPLSTETKPLYLRVSAMDKPDVDLSVFFDEVADMIEEVRQHGGKSLVHCVAGVSRSATLCIVYLMKHMDMSLREAYQHIKEIRPQIRPNTGFFQQLMKYEEELRGSTSVRMIFCESLGREIPDVYEPEYRAMEEFYQRHRHPIRRR